MIYSAIQCVFCLMIKKLRKERILKKEKIMENKIFDDYCHKKIKTLAGRTVICYF